MIDIEILSAILKELGYLDETDEENNLNNDKEKYIDDPVEIEN